MFERYTEKARRVIFFARYEASHYGSPSIETEHILLGLLREDKAFLFRHLPDGAAEKIRAAIDTHTPRGESIPTHVDLPLAEDSKTVLKLAADAADRLGHRHIGTEHLFLGLLLEKSCFAAALLRERGLSADDLRAHLAAASDAEPTVTRVRQTEARVEIHGIKWLAETVRERVKILRQSNWHWQKRPWKARDLAVAKDGKISFDVTLADEAKNFALHSAAWKKDQCAICRWELFESEDQPQHSTGYTNGRDWVCVECYEKFLQGPDYFATTYPEIT